MVAGLGAGKLYDEQVVSIVNRYFKEYLEDKITLDNAIKKMNDDVYFYLNE
jgi:hypothetical protein